MRPELEVFDTGHLVQVKEMIQRRAARRPGDDPAVHGHRLRRARRSQHVHGDGQHRARPAAVFSAFSISRMQLPFVAMAALAGGNVRVGLEDNLYLGPGHLATNAELVARAVQILEGMNVRVKRPDEVRDELKLVKHCDELSDPRARPGRTARRRRDRWRLGGAVRAQRRRRATSTTPTPRRRARSARCSTTPAAPSTSLTDAPLSARRAR